MGSHLAVAAIPPKPNPKTRENEAEEHAPSVSYFQKTVELRDWWLVKSDKDFGGRRLAIAGANSTGKRALRVFNSAPITRRYDIFTLETADGIIVFLSGFINKARTIENGFPPEIFKHFVFGFPPSWEECANKFIEQESGSGIDLGDKLIDEGNGDPSYHNNLNDHASDIPVKETSTNTLDHSLGGFVEVSVSRDKDCPSMISSSTDDRMENGGSGDLLGGASSLVQDLEGMIRYIDTVGVARDFFSPAIETSQSLQQTFNFREDLTTLGAVDSEVEEHIFSPSEVKRNIVIALKSGCIRSTPSGNPKDDRMREPYSRSQAIEDSEVLEQRGNHLEDTMMSSGLRTGVEAEIVTLSEVRRNALNATASICESRKRSYEWKSLKDNKKHAATFGSHAKKKERTLTSDAQGQLDGKEWQRNPNRTWSSCARLNIREAMIRAGKKLKSPSEKSKSQENMPSVSKKGSSNRKKAKRTIDFDFLETPRTKERRETTCILSPESFSVKRSRSGRLLLPILEFWRGQVPVYDADRNITGIQEELNSLKPSRGSKSEPKLSKRR